MKTIKKLGTAALRKAFLDYFASQSHLIVPSSSLIPNNDPSLLFTNAGMVQFKNAFLGLESPPAMQVASSQRCMRAGGKHNDLENVGYTARHHTFFEMLGNFSFGSYFKEGAIRHAFHFLTQILGIPVERLWITVFEDDQEAEALWIQKIGIDPARVSRCGTADNFWSMGDTGPCGPCTEIYYDHGPEIPGGPPGSPDAEGDRYVEIWNLVFMQFNRDADGILSPLPTPAVDTGMGLERIAAVMQGVHNNYDIDLFRALSDSLCALGSLVNPPKHAVRAIADHIRACAFLIADGVLPSNEGRSYVLRRIARRAMRHGYALGFKEPFLQHLVKPLVAEMGDSYPRLASQASHIEQVLYQEALQFDRTLDQGLKILEQDLLQCTSKVLPGETVFKLYDTYGFPVDLTADIVRERGMRLDTAGFEQAMQAQKNRSRESGHFAVNYSLPKKTALRSDEVQVTGFIGYESLEGEARVLACYDLEGRSVDSLQPGTKASVLLDHTPFYAESGGQIGDQGVLRSALGIFQVHTTQKVGTAYVHQGLMQEGTLHVGDTVQAEVDKQQRARTARNHSATHLLHAVLGQFLGNHVHQKGSLVEAHRLRFDFSHGQALSPAQLIEIEQRVNQKILENTLVQTDLLSMEEALAQGAVALFGEKYGQSVRMLSMGNRFSVELCGGTHAQRTGDIGCFKITAEYGVASGVRRIEAVTGDAVLAHCTALEDQLASAAALMHSTVEGLPAKITQILEKSRSLDKELQQIKKHLLGQGAQGTAASPPEIRNIQGKKVLAVSIAVGDLKTLREHAEHLRDQWGLSVVLVAGLESEDAPKVQMVLLVAGDCTTVLQANSLLKQVVAPFGGQGGGRADLAQGGGNRPQDLEAILGSTYNFVEKALQSVTE